MQQTAAGAALFLGLGVDGGGDDLAGGEVELRGERGEVCLEGGEVADAGVVDEVVCCVCGERHFLFAFSLLDRVIGGEDAVVVFVDIWYCRLSTESVLSVPVKVCAV
ncbi:hypothetical protein BDW42DRAFT_168669 [Aspergillus taichungensis]|uniref:Uncharacterized protein n=1 Tax=Aspergillus taichungensis TaxID=482145 RepID=A0A2J5HW16_9EURO|nr:hypothetical protein BDW42DRAFT_168669 [Aspergillus taichungensis]